MEIFALVILFIAVIFIARSLKVVPQQHAWVVERLGKYHATLAPGLSIHRIGGHTKGLQVVRVWTARGWLVLASDASHYYANMEQGRPFPSVADIGEMLDGFRKLRELASSQEHIVPGHDPLVLALYPPARAGLDAVVRLDLAPKSR